MPAQTHVLGRSAASSSAASLPKCGGGVMEDIIIVNHHLFFADLAIKLQADGAPDAGILPEAAAVIFDEAHESWKTWRKLFGISVSNLRMDDLARDDVESSMQHNRRCRRRSRARLAACASVHSFSFSLLLPGDGRLSENRREFLEENGDEFLGAEPGIIMAASWKTCRKSRRGFQLRPADAGVAGAASVRRRWNRRIAILSSGLSVEEKPFHH